MVYFCKNNENLFDISEILKYLPEERRKKVDKLRINTDKNNAIIAWLLLMCGTKQLWLPDLSYDENGKPYFKEFPDTHFNISHCKYGVVCGISDKPIGVDIQDIRPFNLRVAKRVCNTSELEFLINTENKEYEFIKLWTKKEAALKKSGIGISGNIKNAITSEISIKTYCYDNYIISVCE